MNRCWTIRIVAGLISLVLVLGSCGGDDGAAPPVSTFPGEVFVTVTAPAVGTTTLAPTTTTATSGLDDLDDISTTVAPQTTVPPVTTEPRASTTTTAPPTLAEASRYYRAASRSYTERRDRAVERYGNADGEISWAKTPAYCRARAAGERAWSATIREFVWPRRVEDEIAAELRATRRVVTLWDRCSERPGTAAAQEPLMPSFRRAWRALGRATDAVSEALGT